MYNNIQKAIDTFISGCWKKFDDYYKAALYGRCIYIYGSGTYGKFLFQAFSHLGYEKQIRAFINDYVTEEENLFGVPVNNLNKFEITNGKDIIVIGVQEGIDIIEKLKTKGLDYINADIDHEFYQNNLMFHVYKCINESPIWNIPKRIEMYYSGILGNDDEILSLYSEPQSKEIIKNRLLLYRTGDVSYIDNMPVNYHQYFHDDYYSISEKEIFVDCGAFDGDSIEQFVEYTKGKYQRIIAFEPDSISFEKLCEKTKKYHDVYVSCCATGKENSKMCFSSKGALGSTFSKEGTAMIDVKKLDDIFDSEKVTLIKMDIEGAELDTLMGAENLIKRCKPKIAVCIYHKLEDIITIPRYLLRIVPEYRFKVRHHSNSMCETVLYAEV